MEKETIFETKYWIVKHHPDSRYSGYLIALCKEPVLHIHELSAKALAKMSLVLAQTETLLIKPYNPYRVVTFKMGFAKEVNCHFNLIPISYDLLAEILEQGGKPCGSRWSGCFLYIARKYCERELNSAEQEELLKSVSNLRDIVRLL